ncbi:hypothetical protein RhiirA4_540004 [Rhizophagus irregularis]|uniref:Crinkler family protein n=1 Tax=Rhizophagus irregularis TaxID=588596 RepID=A0A2I1G5P0_9GLOM|nr:hypothetical protein RhiirA4_540004 [Rhizophagus irregularis]
MSVYDAIKALNFTKEEKGALRAFFLNNPNKRTEAEELFSTLEDEEIVICLKKLLKLEQPVAERHRKRARYDIEDTDETEEVDEKALKAFWRALKTTEYDYEKSPSQFFTVSGDINFLGMLHKPSELFVRKCYDDLYKIVIDDKTRDLRLSGNPGIGKTFFGYYLIYYLVKQGKTVIYDVKTLKGFVILFGQEEQQVAYLHRTNDAHIIRGYQSNPNVWYIVDGKVPDNCEASAKMVLICSPYKIHYSDFDKRHPDVRYMPVWSLDEINTCRTKIFTDISEEKVRELYLKWGGIPRYILEGATNLNTQKQLKKAITKCNESILSFIGEDDANDEISHKIIHIWTNVPEENNDNIDPQVPIDPPIDLSDILLESLSGQPPNDPLPESSSSVQPLTDPLPDQPQIQVDKSVPYTETVIKFASDYVAREVILNVKKKLIEEFTRNTDSILDRGESNPVLGCIFEQIAEF